MELNHNIRNFGHFRSNRNRRLLHILKWIIVIAAAFIVFSIIFWKATGTSVMQAIGIGQNYVFKVDNEKCTQSDAKMILLSYQKENADPYGISVWQYEKASDKSLEYYLKTQTLTSLAQAYTLDVLAEEKGISLTDSEEAKADKAAKAYLKGLSSEEVAYTGADENDASELFARYALAQKTRTVMSERIKENEISDDEARIMRAKQIYMKSKDTAQRVLYRLNYGTKFSVMADAYNEADSVNVNIDRSKFSASAQEKIFALKDGETSGIISDNGGYYIIYCVKAYDEKLTKAHKEDLVKKEIESQIDGTYNACVKETESVMNQGKWSETTIDTSLKLKGDSFHSVYETYFS